MSPRENIAQCRFERKCINEFKKEANLKKLPAAKTRAEIDNSINTAARDDWKYVFIEKIVPLCSNIQLKKLLFCLCSFLKNEYATAGEKQKINQFSKQELIDRIVSICVQSQAFDIRINGNGNNVVFTSEPNVDGFDNSLQGQLTPVIKLEEEPYVVQLWKEIVNLSPSSFTNENDTEYARSLLMERFTSEVFSTTKYAHLLQVVKICGAKPLISKPNTKELREFLISVAQSKLEMNSEEVSMPNSSKNMMYNIESFKNLVKGFDCSKFEREDIIQQVIELPVQEYLALGISNASTAERRKIASAINLITPRNNNYVRIKLNEVKDEEEFMYSCSETVSYFVSKQNLQTKMIILNYFQQFVEFDVDVAIAYTEQRFNNFVQCLVLSAFSAGAHVSKFEFNKLSDNEKHVLCLRFKSYLQICADKCDLECRIFKMESVIRQAMGNQIIAKRYPLPAQDDELSEKEDDDVVILQSKKRRLV